MTAALSLHSPGLLLPWESSTREDRLFARILGSALVLFLFAAVAVPLLPVPELTREEQEEVPPHLARVLLEKKELPKPEVVEPKPREEPKPEPVPKDVVPPTTVNSGAASVGAPGTGSLKPSSALSVSRSRISARAGNWSRFFRLK